MSLDTKKNYQATILFNPLPGQDVYDVQAQAAASGDPESDSDLLFFQTSSANPLSL